MLSRVAVTLRPASEFTQHGSCVTHLSIVGDHLLSASLDSHIKLHEVTNGNWKVIRDYDGHNDGVQSVLVMGSYFLSCSDEGRVCFHHLTDTDPLASAVVSRGSGLNSIMRLVADSSAVSENTVSIPFLAASDSGVLVSFTLAITAPADKFDTVALAALSGDDESFAAALSALPPTAIKAKIVRGTPIEEAHEDAVNALVPLHVIKTLETPDADWRDVAAAAGLFVSVGDDGRVAVWDRAAAKLAAVAAEPSGALDRPDAVAARGGDDDDDDGEEYIPGQDAAKPAPPGCIARVECGGDAVSVAAARPAAGADGPPQWAAVVGVRHVAVALGWEGAPRARLGGTSDYVRQVHVGGVLITTATDDGQISVYRRADVDAAVTGRGGGAGDALSAPDATGCDDGLPEAEPAYVTRSAHGGSPIFALACGRLGGEVCVITGDNDGRVVVHAVDTAA